MYRVEERRYEIDRVLGMNNALLLFDDKLSAFLTKGQRQNILFF